MSGSITSEKTVRALKDLGLTEYEIYAYLTLVQHGELSAGAVSKQTSIPYSKVYSVLENLERKGWVELGSGRPKLYYPRSPSEAMRAEITKQENKMRELETLIVSELQPAYEKREIREKPEIWIIRGEENISAKIREILKKVDRELVVALPMVPKGVFTSLIPSLNVLMDRKVSILFLTTPEALKQLPPNIPNLAETRTREDMFGGGILIDASEAILFLGRTGLAQTMLAIWSDHTSLTQIAKVYFQHLWETARPV